MARVVLLTGRSFEAAWRMTRRQVDAVLEEHYSPFAEGGRELAGHFTREDLDQGAPGRRADAIMRKILRRGASGPN